VKNENLREEDNRVGYCHGVCVQNDRRVSPRSATRYHHSVPVTRCHSTVYLSFTPGSHSNRHRFHSRFRYISVLLLFTAKTCPHAGWRV